MTQQEDSAREYAINMACVCTHMGQFSLKCICSSLSEERFSCISNVLRTNTNVPGTSTSERIYSLVGYSLRNVCCLVEDIVYFTQVKRCKKNP